MACARRNEGDCTYRAIRRGSSVITSGTRAMISMPPQMIHTNGHEAR